MESLKEFLERTAGFTADSLPGGGFRTNPALTEKVGADGKLRPFMGNTVVFPLPQDARREIGRLRDRLYRLCAPALAEPLEEATFHITLHDLLSGEPSRELEERVARVREPALARVRRIAEGRERAVLRSTALFNMVGSSMVLGFAPAEEESWGRLAAWYETFQEAVRLDYPLTPHVTLAYFRPGEVTAEQAERLRAAVDEAGRRERILVELSGETLEYQTFSDMGHYRREL